MFSAASSKPLLISSLITHASRFHGEATITSTETAGTTHKTTWAGIELKSRQLASALNPFGFLIGDHLAILAGNHHRHLETLFAVTGAGQVCHTLDPELSVEQLIFLLNQSQDRALFFDRHFASLVRILQPMLDSLQHLICLGPPEADIQQALPDVLFYDSLLEQTLPTSDWPNLDENTPSMLCHTEGSSGAHKDRHKDRHKDIPRGVYHTHRSTVLHTYASSLPDSLRLSSTDTVLPALPMHQAIGWGIPFAAAMNGANLSLPGSALEGDHLIKLIDDEEITLTLADATVWQDMLDAARDNDNTLAPLVRAVIGGYDDACKIASILIQQFGCEAIHAWGMKETASLVSTSGLKGKHLQMDRQQRLAINNSQGRPPYGIDLRLIDNTGRQLPHDGQTPGHLQVRGHWLLEDTCKSETHTTTQDGWTDTGQIACVDEDGYIMLIGQGKDSLIREASVFTQSVNASGPRRFQIFDLVKPSVPETTSVQK